MTDPYVLRWIVWIVWIGVVAAATTALLLRSAPYLRAAAADRKVRKMLEEIVAIDEGELPRRGGEGAPA